MPIYINAARFDYHHSGSFIFREDMLLYPAFPSSQYIYQYYSIWMPYLFDFITLFYPINQASANYFRLW